MKIIQQPIENCYWVVPGKFLAGEYPRNKDEESSRVKIDALISAGVNAFIDLTEEDEDLLPYTALLEKASHERFPIRDVSVPNSVSTTVTILNTIDRHIQQDRVVYLHCWGGVGRTGMIVGCWLARHGLNGESALIRLRELWLQCRKSSFRKSPETKEQESYILNWKEGR
jgi:protein-tyrosine phosphatase